MKVMKCALCLHGSLIDGNSAVPKQKIYNAYFSLYRPIDSSGRKVRGEMSGLKCPDICIPITIVHISQALNLKCMEAAGLTKEISSV